MPKVSVILPVYNGEKYLKKAIESVTNQTLKDWELIIVNDCSTDRTEEIVRQYLERDERIQLITNSINERLPRSLNIGFKQAKGEYFTWTSDDNEYMPDALKKMTAYLEGHPEISMVSAQMNVIDLDGQWIGNSGVYQENEMLSHNSVGACFLYRKSCAEAIGEYDPDKFLVEDYDYWLRYLVKYHHIEHLQEKLYNYRIHTESLTMTRREEIRLRTNRLRLEYAEQLEERFKTKDKLVELYYDLKLTNSVSYQETCFFYDLVPELKREQGRLDSERPIIVYGAGVFGDKAFRLYGDQVSFYSDGNEQLYGKRKNGIEIIDNTTLNELQKHNQILIAVSTEKIFSVIQDLEKIGVDSFFVFLDR